MSMIQSVRIYGDEQTKNQKVSRGYNPLLLMPERQFADKHAIGEEALVLRNAYQDENTLCWADLGFALRRGKELTTQERKILYAMPILSARSYEDATYKTGNLASATEDRRFLVLVKGKGHRLFQLAQSPDTKIESVKYWEACDSPKESALSKVRKRMTEPQFDLLLNLLAKFSPQR